tara:strand:+ start:133181 stop:134428 length:1248 start_codon:yes stop_codon:yes gene_type:complete
VQAEIIAIGDEILIGQTVDTNSTFIAQQLTANGVKVLQKRVVADDKDLIIEALNSISDKTNLVFLTGGLGPTKDDITKNTLTEYFGGELVFRPEVFEHIKDLFKSFGRVPSEINRQQAFLPNSCRVVSNKLGTASGMHFEKNEVHYFSLPGVPYETEYLVEKKIVPWIEKNLISGTAEHKTIITQGVPESDLAEMLENWEKNLSHHLSLAYLPSPGLVKLRLSSYDLKREEGKKLIEAEVVELKEILGDIVFGENAESLEDLLGKILLKQKLSISTAESCTGGYIAHLITKIAGSSAYYKGSVVSYANEAKMDLLKVKETDLINHGAVSKSVVEQMAIEARNRFKTDYSIATSGIAGPDGGSEQKPVGTIWIAIAGPNRVKSKKFQFGRNRIRNIKKTALMAMDLLRIEIQKNHH